MSELLVPDDLRTFLKGVVRRLDRPEPTNLDGEDAFESEFCQGGRVAPDTFRFRYRTKAGKQLDVTLSEAQIRDIADGLLIEVPAEPYDPRAKRRPPRGEPLLAWGEYSDDALRLLDPSQLYAAIAMLHAASADRPRLLRVWSASDDQLVAAMSGDRCALYVVESPEGYATSMGDHTLTEAFEVLDHEGKPLMVPLADCVSWDYAWRAILRFVEHSDLGDIPVEGRIPSLLLMMGEIERTDILEARPGIATDIAKTSLARMAVPVHVDTVTETTEPVAVEEPPSPLELARWAKRFLEHLHNRSLIELGPGPSLDEISYQLGGLLGAHAIDAEHSLEMADWVANEIRGIRGIAQLFATGTDLQVALRRSRDA